MRDNIKVVSANPAPEPARKSRKKMVRAILLIVGPLVVIIGGGAMYLLGGRYISTDNAYTKADIVSVSPEISGPIASVSVTDNQPVKKGDILFTIDSKPFDIALDLAKANLAAARLEIGSLRAQYAQSAADIKASAADRDYAQKNYDRERALQRKNSAAMSASEMDKMVHDLEAASQRVTALQQEQAKILASLDGDADMPVENHAKIKAAQAAVDQAQLNIARTVIHAPADGVSGAAPHAGDYAHAQVPSLSVVATSSLRIEANYKETDLTRMHPGQPVTIAIDTYPGHEWSGTVESISPASESEFSILPAQNATGNWVKVVQRIPVRVTINHQQNEPPLRSGMSAEVTVDTGRYPNLTTAQAREAAP